jgi:hypothetical protein
MLITQQTKTPAWTRPPACPRSFWSSGFPAHLPVQSTPWPCPVCSHVSLPGEAPGAQDQPEVWAFETCFRKIQFPRRKATAKPFFLPVLLSAELCYLQGSWPAMEEGSWGQQGWRTAALGASIVGSMTTLLLWPPSVAQGLLNGGKWPVGISVANFCYTCRVQRPWRLSTTDT